MLDPRAGIDEPRDVLVRDGEIAELGPPGTLTAPDDAETVEAQAATSSRPSSTRTCTCARPARSTRRTSRPARAPRAAGGFCAVIAMPNTDPVVDSAPLLRSLRDAAARDARIPVGFLPAITRGCTARS